VLIQTLFEAFHAKPYKICGYEMSEERETVVKYSLRNKRAGKVFRKAAKDILLDNSLRKNFDYDDLVEITSVVQRDSILRNGDIDHDVLGRYQRANKPLYAFYPYLVALTVVVWCFCALLGHRFLSASFFGVNVVLPGGIVIFPVIYFMADLIQEVYGYARLRQTLWICIVSHISIGILTSLVMSMQPASFVDEHSYRTVMDQQWRMIIGNVIGMIAGFTINGVILAKLKIKFNGKNLWLRTIVSTLCAEFVYSYVCSFIAFHHNLAVIDLIKLQFLMVVVKVMWEVVATPLLYVTSHLLKKREGVDVYDYYTNFNPFSLAV
jgi:uncharacterized integral membrane protein (TIGR00697 family)